MKIVKKSITEHIYTDYKDFAIYAVESRGIPNFYDMFTPVQRYIVQNTPRSFVKTIKVIGDCMSNGYHHGDASINDAITLVTRTYQNSMNLLEGDGFFGNMLTPEASSPRYTSVRINPKTYDAIYEYSTLNRKDDEGAWDPLKLEIPLGICTKTLGMGPGFKADMLPRKLEHVEEYLNGTRKKLKPYFMNFTGKIRKNPESDKTSSWIIEPDITINDAMKVIHIKDIPPVLKYTSFVVKLNKILENHKCKIVNNTKSNIDIKLGFNKNISLETFRSVADEVVKTATAKFTELVTMIKDNAVLQYDTIENYLDDYKNYREFLHLEWYEYHLTRNQSELEFLKAKKEYLEYMVAKKRTHVEIDNFLKKYEQHIYNRLDVIRLRFLNNDVIKSTIKAISDMEKQIKSDIKRVKTQKKLCNTIKEIVQNARQK